MIDYDRLRHWHFPVIEHRYTADDCMRYALALGAGHDPQDPHELRYVADHAPGTPLALPSMAVVLGFPGSWMADPGTGIDFARIVHGEESLVLHAPLPAAGTVRAHHRVIAIVDKGEGRGALITYDKDLVDADSGCLLATVRHTTFARGDGGFSSRGGPSDPPPPAPTPVPLRQPDRTCELATLPQQALLYRLCADHNPLHCDPAAARRAGFERPILHGLCTYGMACRALVSLWCDHEPARLRSVSARFSSPVLPGDTLRFETFREGPSIAFRASIVASGRIVLDHGHAHVG